MKRIKFLSLGIECVAPVAWRRQLPATAPVIGDCEFLFDSSTRDYDWLVVYDNFPRLPHERFSMWREQLSCPPENTLFVTAEPSTIKSYEPAFLNQFGHVLTGHEEWSIQHPGVIRSQPALRWFYGYSKDQSKSLDQMLDEKPLIKTNTVSTVCSSKQQRHTLHQKRYDFTRRLKSAMPGLDVYGHGVRPMNDKAEAVDPYRYHIAIENHSCDHHWTEKVSDVFLGWALPIYYGCTNLKDYFPEESFIEIDIHDFDRSLAVIRNAINNGEYEKRFDAIAKSRELVLKKYNLFSVIADLTENIGRPAPHKPTSGRVLSRHALRKSSPRVFLSYALQSIQRRWRSKKR